MKSFAAKREAYRRLRGRETSRLPDAASASASASASKTSRAGMGV